MSDLVIERLPKDLRQSARILLEFSTFETAHSLMTEAADEIERLRDQVAELNQAAEDADARLIAYQNGDDLYGKPKEES